MSDISASEEFKKILEEAAKATGTDLKIEAQELALHANKSAARLASLVGQAGYDKALIAERDSLVLRAGILAVNQADAIQARFIGIVEGALSMAARLLV